MFSSSCLKVIVEAAGAAAVVVVLLVRLAPAPEDAARFVKAPEVDELVVGRVRIEVVAAGKEVEELMLPRLSPVDEVLVKPPLPKFSPKPVEDAVVVAAFVVAAAAEVRLKPGVEAVLAALLALKPPKLKAKVGAVAEVVVVADDNPAPPVAEGLEVVDRRG